MLGSTKIVGFVPSRDLRRSREFYEKTLGLAFTRDDGYALVFTAGDRMIRVADVGRIPDFQPYPFTVLGWEVDDVGRTAAALRERGVAFERYSWMQQDELGVWETPGGDKVAWFKDPDGNVLSLSHHV